MQTNLTDLKNSKMALVLSGGVVKAASWHLGVTLALEELGFSFASHGTNDPNQVKGSLEIGTFVGSSAGNLINLYITNGFTSQDVIDSFLKVQNSKIKPISYKEMLYLKSIKLNPKREGIYDPFSEFPPVIKQILKPILSFSGFFSTEGVGEYINNNILKYKNFEDYKADLFIIATQLDHSRKVIFSKYNYPKPTHDSTAVYYTGIPVAEAACASMSVPPFYTPFPVTNPHTSQIDYYIDGEIRETLSTHVAEDNGCEYIISSWTHTPYHYHDEVGSLANYGLHAICLQAIYLMIQKKIVASRSRRLVAKDILNTVNDYMKTHKFSNTHRKDILNILERKLNFNPRIKHIDIFPTHHDYQLFFANSFSLNPKHAAHAMKMGYKRTMEVFKDLDFK
ncbi:MAG: patatin-like phospholipase family protein [Bacteriovoracaceae bacterium]